MLAPLLGSVFALAGAGLSLAAARQARRQRVFLAGSQRAPGRVIGLSAVPDSSSHSNHDYFPRIRFATPSGREVTFESRLGSEQPVWRVGDEVRVRFPANQPGRAEIDSFLALWGLTALLGGLGTAFLTLGIALVCGLVPL